MADLPLFILDAESRWRLAYDALQWIIQRRTQKPRTRSLKGHAIVDSGWRGNRLHRTREAHPAPLHCRARHCLDA